MTSLQDCIVLMLQEVANVSTEPLDATLILKECMPNSINKHYEFLGQAALELAVTLCLRERFRQYNTGILSQMKGMLLRNQILATAIGKKYRLNECHTGEMSAEQVAERLMGILQDMSGSTTVVGIIMPVLADYAPQLLSKLPRTLRQSMGLLNTNGAPTVEKVTRPIAVPRRSSSNANTMISVQYDTLIKRCEGASILTYESRTSESKMVEWGCKAAFQLSTTAKWQAHVRFAQNKKKAKALVVHDIVKYYDGNRERHQVDSLAVSDPGQPDTAPYLPIDPKDYVMEPMTPSSPTTPKPSEWYAPAGSVDSYAIHIADKRDRVDDDQYNREMMDILLGDFRGINLEHEGKRHKCASMANTMATMPMATSPVTTTSPVAINPVATNPMPPVAQSTYGFLPGAELLPNSIHNTNNTNNQVDLTARQIIVRKLDISRIDRMLKDPIQVSNPKSSMFSYIYNLPGLELKSAFAESGPAHYRLFEATTSLHAGEHILEGKGMGMKKSDAEQMAILNLMKIIVG